MDFIDSYSYGYDQVNINPLRSVTYADTDYKLFQNKSRDSNTKALQSWVVAAQKNQPSKNPYDDMGDDHRKRMEYVRDNLEDIIDPYSGVRLCRNKVADRVSVPSRGESEIHDLERELAQMRAAQYESRLAVQSKCDKMDFCPSCRMTQKCSSHIDSSELGRGKDSREDVNYLLVMFVVILSAMCLVQYFNTQNMNTTLLSMIQNQHKPPVWLRSEKKGGDGDGGASPYVE